MSVFQDDTIKKLKHKFGTALMPKFSCHATTKLIRLNTSTSTISGSESEKSESDVAKNDLDPRLDLDNHKEILITASSNVDLLQFRDIDSNEFLVFIFSNNKSAHLQILPLSLQH